MSMLRKLFVVLKVKFSKPRTSSSEVDRKTESVIFLPDIAYEKPDGTIIAGIQAWVYQTGKRRFLEHILKFFLKIDKKALTASQQEQLEARMRLFGVNSASGKKLVITNETGHVLQMPETGKNGRSEMLAAIQLSDKEHISNINFQVAGDDICCDDANVTAIYAPSKGWSIISDIDDTIKVSSVGNKKKLLINTFLEDFVAVENMAAFYSHMNRAGDIAYHYVSSSPVELYPLLKEFLISTGYPLGSIHLREATNWKNIISFSKISKKHKYTSIKRILQAYPKRSFLLIGDSSENDAEIYADFKQNFPNQVVAIIIRNVTPDIPVAEICRPFSNLDKSDWIVTHSVDEMKKFVAAIN